MLVIRSKSLTAHGACTSISKTHLLRVDAKYSDRLSGSVSAMIKASREREKDLSNWGLRVEAGRRLRYCEGKGRDVNQSFNTKQAPNYPKAGVVDDDNGCRTQQKKRSAEHG
jgi:hypothetical protein